ncbi:hypothetical protein E4T44_05301 [Aureobasidium sp. EXF-8845]|nr:hypothetical protein E4T45_09576 [Aureobasidium sp. EXF-8846]KAI4846004.1 hypothetical protein E4T44_05301 [Aureobasidium sp. EXF-8845]
MNFVYPTTMGAFPQQAFFNTSAMAHSTWLLQQPKDSGYASDDHDLFEKAFESHLPSIPQISSHHTSQQTPVSAFSDSSSESPSSGSHSSPFEYADSLCTSSNYETRWNPYESLDLSVKKLSIDAGITSMTGYCDIDSMLTAAYHNTSASQPQRFSAFSQSPPRSITSQQQQQYQLQQQEDSVETPSSPALGRPKNNTRVPHQKVEQRYRENLQLNFDRLRGAVPEIATLQPARSGQPPKPSKAEVLAAASDYIRQLEEENEMLRESMMNAAAGELRRKRARTG